eukprot:scaffold2248_cov261-Pinguiococcus_pyrenoidosus.AAC.7
MPGKPQYGVTEPMLRYVPLQGGPMIWSTSHLSFRSIMALKPSVGSHLESCQTHSKRVFGKMSVRLLMSSIANRIAGEITLPMSQTPPSQVRITPTFSTLGCADVTCSSAADSHATSSRPQRIALDRPEPLAEFCSAPFREMERQRREPR